MTYERLAAAPTEQGKAALSTAIAEALRSRPSRVALRADLPAEGGPAAELVRLRAETAARAFVQSGVDAHAIRTELRPVEPAAFRDHQDALDIQLSFGEPAQD